jgi:hypothetical protein
MEVEASRATPTRACAAFNAMHDVLQEVVGLPSSWFPVVRGWTPALHEYLGDRLAAPKWPQCLVFMDASQESHQQAVASSWVSACCQSSTTLCTHREHFEAKCPRTPLETPFLCTVVASASAVEKVLVEALVTSETSNLCGAPSHSRGSLVCVLNIDRVETIEAAEHCWTGTLFPVTLWKRSIASSPRRCWRPPKQWMPSRHSSELEVVGPRGPSCPGGSRALYRSST